ncbi:hypothetical protein C1H76_8722 [Elsinoe australis]|uniref:Uncharacterized protein n=1 Tax=Elsinoe australis TaxID=40998 RepID=A0A4U7AU07_9PEZI|nr:hypothetical protein C1H76_8722 [Elsinoe australis]
MLQLLSEQHSRTRCPAVTPKSEYKDAAAAVRSTLDFRRNGAAAVRLFEKKSHSGGYFRFSAVLDHYLSTRQNCLHAITTFSVSAGIVGHVSSLVGRHIALNGVDNGGALAISGADVEGNAGGVFIGFAERGSRGIATFDLYLVL